LNQILSEYVDPLTREDYAYLFLSFIIFSVAVAIIRNLYNTFSNKNNIKKEIKKRFKNVFDNKNDSTPNHHN
jgi:hypothetical protein